MKVFSTYQLAIASQYPPTPEHGCRELIRCSQEEEEIHPGWEGGREGQRKQEGELVRLEEREQIN